MSLYPWNPGVSTVADLDANTPIGATDPVADVDDSIRQIKNYLKDPTEGPDAKIASVDAKIADIVGGSLLVTILESVYPIGSLYSSTVSTNPNTLLGFGTWVAISDAVLAGIGGSIDAGETGSWTQSIAEANLPSHTHGEGSLAGTSSTNGAHDHSGSYARQRHGGGVAGSTASAGYPEEPGNTVVGDILYILSDGDHSHTITISGTTGATGGGTDLNIKPKTYGVYIWRRTG